MRGCSHRLSRQENSLRCAAGHHFDRARQGYWNLTQPQDRRSEEPGDRDEAVLARRRWLDRGLASGLIEAFRPWVQPIPVDRQRSTPRILDLGCGEGTIAAALFAGSSAAYCGVDLSKRAIKLAARRWPQATWVLANADRTLPVPDAEVDQVMSLFGRRPTSEIARVLVPGGVCLIAVPAAEDLVELRAGIQLSGRLRNRGQAIVKEMSEAGFACVKRGQWRQRVTLSPDSIADALDMTYRGVRRSQRARLETMTELTVTLAADLLQFRLNR